MGSAADVGTTERASGLREYCEALAAGSVEVGGALRDLLSGALLRAGRALADPQELGDTAIWEPPTLTVRAGSGPRASVLQIDVDEGAVVEQAPRRPGRQRIAWQADREAAEIAAIIGSGTPDKRVIQGPRGVRVVTARIIPPGARDLADRRRDEFFAELDALLAGRWRRFGNTYRPLN